jgi:molecular chaperone DnaJ
MFVQVVPCPSCKGSGQIIDSPCKDCKGSGLARKNRRIAVKIPAGIGDGNQLRLRGQGEAPASKGVAGDLYVNIHVAPHKHFTRAGDNLLYELEIGFPEAALGTQVTVPTLGGETEVKIPSGTQPGEIIKLKGKGMPRLRGYGNGDLLLRTNVKVPQKLTKEQKRLIADLGQELKKAPSRNPFSRS